MVSKHPTLILDACNIFLHSLKKFLRSVSSIEPLVSNTISVSGFGISSKYGVITPSSIPAFLYDQSMSYLTASFNTLLQSTIGLDTPILFISLTSLFVV
mgnify:CR=1 FL=1